MDQGSEEILASGHEAIAAVRREPMTPPPPVPAKKGRVVVVNGTPVELPKVGSPSLLSPEYIKAVNLRAGFKF